MLRITQQSSADAARQYYTASGADYYAEGQEVVGHWGGEAARRLGLEGKVGRRAFNLMCDNRHPQSGLPLTARTKDNRTVGYDFTFSVPKSVSLLYALAEDPEAREAVLWAFRKSVAETMRDVEAEMKARVRKAGRNEELVTGNMAWGEFIHFTSRPVDGVPDPQLHAHCFVFNATHDEKEGEWKAGQFRDLKRDAPFWEAAFRVRLANRLQDLGLALEVKKGDFEVAGLSDPALLRKFSRRTEKIEDLARQRGIDDPEEKARLGGLSRERKDRNLTWEELLAEWKGRLLPGEAGAVAGVLANRFTHARPQQENARAVDFAVRHAFAKESVLPEKRLLAEALTFGLGAVTVEGVRREYGRAPLLVEEHDGRRVATTSEVLTEEDRIVDFARSGRGTRRPLGDPARPFRRDWLNAGQRRAVAHVLSSRDRVILLRGAAGTGKTSLMQEAVEGIREGGHEVVVLAPSSTASRDVLRGEGFRDADTVAMFLKSEAMQQRAAWQVIWVDEAGMLDGRSAAALFDVAARVNARVVLAGDRMQHASPSRGNPLKLLEQEAGVPSVAVTEIMRQRGDYKKAVHLLSEGRAEEGLLELDRLGWVREVPGGERHLRLAEAYLQAARERKADGKQKTAIVVSPTHAEGERITAVIRGQLAAQGRLGEAREFTAWAPLHLTEAQRGEAGSYAPGDMVQFHQTGRGFRSGQRLFAGEAPLPLDQAAKFQAYRPVTLSLAAGDRVRITANGKTADGRHRLNNGALYTVSGFTPAGDIVADNGWVIGRDFGHLAHGYVVTSHASQGKTVDRVFIGQSSVSLPATSREQFYVSASRGREQALVFTDDRQALLEAVGRGAERLTAREVFRRPAPPGRERLTRHLAFMRRQAHLPHSHAAAGPERHHASKPREVHHER